MVFRRSPTPFRRAACPGWLLAGWLTAAWPVPAAEVPSAGSQAAASRGSANAVGDDRLHVPSPDWRDQVIYFLITDRFEDGSRGNNDQGAGEFAPGDPARYNGGDLRGVEKHLDYIQGLGATAVWLTPPVANLWWNTVARHGGYHGYWAEDFMAVDAHLGSLRDYQQLSRRLHGAGMYLVQDIVLNHTGSFFDYGSGWSADDPSKDFSLVPDSRGRTAPSQSPFDRNDARDPAQRASGIYHWTPNITNFKDPGQVADYQMGGLDDLASENPLVRSALRRSYGHWIREAGVDAFRVDTAFYVPPEALADFLYADDAEHPGVLKVAAASGRARFHVFGEGFAIDKPFEDQQARRIEAYTRQSDGSALMPAMINFPLYAALGDVFARGQPAAVLGHRITSMMRVHEQPELMPTFVDNHDVDRFLAGGGQPGLQQALLAMMTLPGIPTIYYGTEQAFTVPRAAMFKRGSDSGGRDHFDTRAPLYRYIARAAALRREYRLFSRGRPTVLKALSAGPGALAYRMSEGDRSAIVVFNSADHDTLLDNLETGLDPGTSLRGVFDIHGAPVDASTGEDGRLTLALPPRAGKVWLVGKTDEAFVAPTRAITLAYLEREMVEGDFQVHGTAVGVDRFQLVVDGELSRARPVVVDADGRWSATVSTATMTDPALEHEVVAWSETSGIVSPARRFRVSLPWRELAVVDDPAGDDRGPEGNYAYPADGSWAGRQADIRQLRVAGAGGALKLSLRMHSVSTPWNPPNGFDHVAFTVFVQLPGRDGGASVMPQQNASLPDGMRWHYRLRAHGWSNAMFTADGASAGNEGTTSAPAAGIAVDAANDTISFLLPASALGGASDLSGAKIHISTWDYDGGFRALAPAASASAFSGGDGARDPLWMDAITAQLP